MTEMADKPIIQNKSDVSEAQADFLRLCEEVHYGTLEVKIKDGQPVMSKIIEQWRKHD